MTKQFARKDLLGIKDISKQEIERILDETAKMFTSFKQGEKMSYLSGKNVVTLFYENSTRTRTSFESAAKLLGATVINISASASSVQKGETLVDTGITLDSLLTDIIIIRHPMGGAPWLLARNVKASVINGGDGMNEHPTQCLLDLFTIKRNLGEFKGLKVVISGDIKYSRVARSNIWAMQKLGVHVTVSAPYSLLPAGIEQLSGVTVEPDLDKAVQGANVIMGLRVQSERQNTALFPSVKEFNSLWGITEARVASADSNVIVMHPGPINRGVEIDGSVRDGEKSAVSEQVTAGVAVRMAVMHLLMNKEGKANG